MKWLFWLLPVACFSIVNPESRRSSAPFISGDAFRAYSDFVYDELDTTLDPRDVSWGSTIFVETYGSYLNNFFTEIHPHILSKYILITHNGDFEAPGRFSAYLDDDRLIAWFGQNYDGYPHPKMHPIPIGIINYNSGVGDPAIFKQLQFPKKNLAYMCFNNWTYPKERDLVTQLFSRAPFCNWSLFKPYREYLMDASSSKFSISPRGYGLDTHRIWESLYLNTIPIVKTSSLNTLYADLPILIVDEWEQVNETFLNEKYEEFSRRSFNMEKLTMAYWTELIDSYK